MRQAAVTVGLLSALAAGCSHLPPKQTMATNHPPTIRARCEPCSVTAGQTVTLSAEGTDPDGNALTYTWHAPAGTLATPAAARTSWSAPTAEGPVPITVKVDDGKGGMASDVITVQVKKIE